MNSPALSSLCNRRDFVRLFATGASALSYLLLTGGCESLANQIRNRPLRRCIRPNDPDVTTDLAFYAAAVTAMKALPAGDQRNWTKQAEIHLNRCQHNNWFFFPWHRAYLLYFEQICRKLSGAPRTWGLPYWNWSEFPQVPGPFWSGALLHAPRIATSSSTASNAIVGPVALESILNEPNFNLFAGTAASAGRMEGSPHNYIHGFVGGTMGTYMSPLDPIFWCHHNMVEFGWVDWNIERNHANTNDPNWLNHDFNGNFVDADGNAVNVSVALTMLFPLLSYRFARCGAPGTRSLGPDDDSADFKKLDAALRTGKTVRLDFRRQMDLARDVTLATGSTLSRRATSLVARDLDPVVAADRRERFLVTIDHAEAPPTGDVFVRVFVNKPDAGPQTPVEDPHYAGSFFFFTDASAHQHHGGGTASGPRFVVDATDAVRRLSQAGENVDPERLTIQLVLVPFEGRQPRPVTLKIRSVQLGLSPIEIIPTR